MGEVIGKVFIEPAALPQGADGLLQVLFLAVVYGYVLFCASNLISEGSELLLLVPSLAGIVGPILLPILGAVPDGAIVLFSGLGPDAQNQLSVGVGALAGSTIMLLTIPWFMSILGGRVDIVNGEANYKKPRGALATWKKLTPGNWSLTKAGVQPGRSVAITGRIMILTAISYLVIQVPAFYAEHAYPDDAFQQAEIENKFAGCGLVLTLILFFWYLGYQYKQASCGNDEQLESLTNDLRINAVRASQLSLKGALWELAQISGVSGGDAGGLAGPLLTSGSPELNRLRKQARDLLKPFFQQLDKDGDGRLDWREAKNLFFLLHESPSQSQLDEAFRHADSNNSGFIEFEEFVEALLVYIWTPPHKRLPEDVIEPSEVLVAEGGQVMTEGEEEESEEMPEDLAKLPPEVQQWRIKMRAFRMMLTGTVLVLIFSDPMVDVFSEMGARTGVSPFYISFLLAPLASNASELIASYNYSLRKTQRTIGISFSALQGAACMNNTFCLAVFLALIYFRHLVWQFSAETLAIIVVEIGMCLISQIRVHRLLEAVGVLTLYPLSILLVNFLETTCGMD